MVGVHVEVRSGALLRCCERLDCAAVVVLVQGAARLDDVDLDIGKPAG
jgi:hypothetical protein